MRLIALLVPAALVGTFLAAQSRHVRHDVVVVPKVAAAPRTVSEVVVAARPSRAVALRQGANGSDLRIDVGDDLGSTINATVEAAMSAALAGVESADLSFAVAEGILESLATVLGQVAVSVDGTLEIVTAEGTTLTLTADGTGGIAISTTER